MQNRFTKKLAAAAAVLVLTGFIWGYRPDRGQGQCSGRCEVPDGAPQFFGPGQAGPARGRQHPDRENPRRAAGRCFGTSSDPFEKRDPNNPFGEGMPGREFKQRSLGSGFIIDAEGFIVTNNHVVENADQIKVRLFDEREFDAKVIGRDPKTDLALIKIEGANDLVPLKLGDSERAEVGSWVLAVGSPFGLEQTVTAGIVSAKGRFIGAGPYDDFIQTDASINPGNSGGPLLNMNGEVIGINTAIVAQGQGIGFAIPVNLAHNIIAQLKEHGSVTRGWMGVGIQDLTPELAEYYGLKNQKGVLVTQVFPENPADKAGIKTKDVIIAVDGKPVGTGRELSSAVAGMPIGKEVPVKLLRDGKEKTVKVQLSERKETETVAKGGRRRKPMSSASAPRTSTLKPPSASAWTRTRRASWWWPCGPAARPIRPACSRGTSSRRSTASRCSR